MLITVAAAAGARESATANNIMVVIKLLALALFIARRRDAPPPRELHAVRAERFTGIHQGAAIVFFAYIGFDAISTAAEETKQPAAQPADRHPRRPRHLHGDLRHRRRRADRHGAVQGARGRRPAGARARAGRASTRVGWIVALGAAVSMSAVLLVFQYGQPRIFFAMARDGLLPEWAAKLHPKTRIPYTTTLLTGVFVALASLIGDAAETYDLTNIGTLFAFMLVCIGVLVLRVQGSGSAAAVQGAVRLGCRAARRPACLFIMAGCREQAWERFGIWLVIGLLLYFAYGYQHSRLRQQRRGLNPDYS